MFLMSPLILYLVSLTYATSSICPPDYQLDMIFAVDSDGRTDESQYHKFYDFISESIDDFPVGDNQTRVGLVTIDTSPYTVIAPTGNRDILLQKLRRIEYRHNTANAITCLNLAAGVFKQAAPRDKKVKTVVVFETDGTDRRKRDLTIRMAKRLKDQGIEVCVLGINPRIDHDELLGVASRPECYFEANSYSDYKAFVHMLARRVCRDDEGQGLEDEDLE